MVPQIRCGRKQKKDSSSESVMMNISANNGVGLDAKESREEVAAKETTSNLLLMPCVSHDESEKIIRMSPSPGVTKFSIRSGGSGTPCPRPVTPVQTVSQEQPNLKARSTARTTMRKCALCPYQYATGKRRSMFRFPKGDLRQEEWINVCLQTDPDFQLRRQSFICEEHFTPECFAVSLVRNGVEAKRLNLFAVPLLNLVKKGDWRNCQTAVGSDEAAEIEEDEIEYDNGLPTALDFPSELPNSMDCEERLLLEEGTENICEYISCSACGVSQEPCWDHAKFIKDKNTNPLAFSSLPRQLDFETDGHEDTPSGVFSRVSLSSHIVFGPLRGALCSHISSRFAVHDSASRKCYHLESDDTCNWMKYVQFAHDAQSQNLAVYAKEGQIFFVTTRDIQPDEELKIWYSRKYADNVGFVRKNGLDIAKVVKDGMSVTDDGISQNVDEVDSVKTPASDFALMVLDEVITQNSVHDPEELSQDLAEQTASPGSSRVKRKKFASSKIERIKRMKANETDSGTDQEATPVVDDTTTSAEQLISLAHYQPTCDVSSSDAVVKTSDESLTGETAKFDQISGTERKKVKTGQVRCRAIIKFGCSECRIHFPTEQLLMLHNYQHSDDLASEERTCPECGSVFDNLRDLSLHVKEHGKKYFPREECVCCGALIAGSAMKLHFSHQHPEESILFTRKYPCKKCGVEFDSSTAYSEHTAKHGLLIECIYCGKTETTSVAMGRHLALHKETDGFHCPKCSQVSKDYGSLKRHYYCIHDHENATKKPKDATEGLPQKVSKFTVDQSTTIKFPCPICRKSYKTEALVEVHRRFHLIESDKTYNGDDIDKACPECGEQFDVLDALFRHVEGYAVSFNTREPCPVCKKFISTNFMQRHMDGNHPGGQNDKCEDFPCEVCSKVFPSEIKHRAHIQTHKAKKCLLCAEIFDGWIVLGRHAVKAHRQADGFHCPNCDGVFDTFRKMTTHHRNSHDIRSIVSCGICGKMCKHKQELYRHMDVAHGSKEFTHECGVCNKKFMRQSTLRDHVGWAHTALGRKKVQGYQVAFMKKGYVAPRKRMLLDEFPFKCETCQVGFLTEGRILRHRTKFHPDEV